MYKMKLLRLLPVLPVLTVLLPLDTGFPASAVFTSSGIQAYDAHDDVRAPSSINYTPVMPPTINFSWVKYTDDPVLPKGCPGSWDAGGVAAKSIVKSGDTYYMYYQGDDGTENIAIGLATSENLLDWTKSSHNPVLTVSKAGNWDSCWVGMPAVTVSVPGWKMLYEGSDGINSHIGLATSSDGIHWVKYADNPVLEPGSPGAWDDTYIGTPSIVADGDGYCVYYVAATFPPHGAVGKATSSDLITFTKDPANPLLSTGPDGSFDDYEIASSSIEVINGAHLVYLCGYDGETWAIGYAYSTDGKAFVKCGGNPFFLPGHFSWDSLSVQLPIIVRTDNSEYLFYAGAGDGYEEGVAINMRDSCP